MKVEKFRIKNYRSIVDSGDCYLSPKITVLAGKNEAGKTSLLEALRDFTPSRSISDEACPIESEKKPEIHVTFKLYGKDIYDILPNKNNFLEENEELSIEKDIFITIVKKYKKGYEIGNENSEVFTILKNLQNEIKDEIKSGILRESKNFISENSLNFKNNKENLQKQLQEIKNTIQKARNNNQIDNKEGQKYLNNINVVIKSYKKLEEIQDNFIQRMKKKIPDFVLFSTYEDQIPNKVTIPKLEQNEFIEDLSKVSDLDITLLQESENDRKKKQHKKEVNIELNTDYDEFWTQDETSLSVDWDNKNLKFWIEEDNIPYAPKHRSKGKMWHLSFYIKLTAHASKENPPIVLIDDPGLHLHAKAQKDILKKLESVGETSRVIYSTHSPYLIDSENLDRVWLVQREEGEGTEIEKLHAGADKDTLRPVITAIGADTTIGIHTDKQNSIVVEGISDYHYLQAFKEIYGWDHDLDIIPGTGGDSPVDIGSILFGWGVAPIFILDDDRQGKDNKKKLLKKLGIEEDRVIMIPADDGDIEDVFTKDDFKEYVLQDKEKEYESSNSDYLKPHLGDKDKVLLAKKFYELTKSDEEIEFAESTEENIKNIFNKLDTIINNE